MCRKNCQCRSPDGSCDADELIDTLMPEAVPDVINYTPRNLNDQDKEDLRLSFLELKERYSSGLVSLFHQETCHGFSDQLIDDIAEHSNHIFSGKYLTDNLATYSSIHALDVLEVFQELFDDIDHFEQEMDELHMLKKQFTDIESYLISSSLFCEPTTSEMEDFVVADYDLEF